MATRLNSNNPPTYPKRCVDLYPKQCMFWYVAVLDVSSFWIQVNPAFGREIKLDLSPFFFGSVGILVVTVLVCRRFDRYPCQLLS